jgi:hypothetical protein
MPDKPVFCILSTQKTPPKEALDLWKKHGEICGKPGFFYKGKNYRVYFPNIPALWKVPGTAKGGFKVTWPMLRDEVVFTEISGGCMQGVLKDADVPE